VLLFIVSVSKKMSAYVFWGEGVDALALLYFAKI